MRIKVIALLFLLAVGIEGFSQKVKIQGKIADSTTKEALVGATITFSKFRDTAKKFYATTDINGIFRIELNKGGFKMQVRYVGYNSIITPLRARESGSIGIVYLAEVAYKVKGAEIVKRIPPVVINGDTTQYNADAFKTNPDANAEDLVTKMPGISVENGTVQAEGEDVKKVLVDGKEFFGDDPKLALKTLPAEMVDKVQVFDQASDQAQFTGVDDGNSAKAINIITKKDKRRGTFGRFYGGYGTEDRYNAGAVLNVLKENSRFTFLALSNNINQQNFSVQDLFGLASGSSRRRGYRLPSEVTNFLVGPQSGVSITHSLGLNYSGSIGKRFKVTGSYFFNGSDVENNQNLTRTTFVEEDSNQFYNEASLQESQNFNHRINLRLEYQIDSNNSVIATPKLSLQANNSKNNLNGLSQLQTEQAINSLINNNGATVEGYNFSNNLLLRHKFAKRGRTLSVNFGTDFNNQDADNYLLSINEFYRTITVSDSIDQITDNISEGNTLSTRVTYTEGIGKKGLLQVSYDGRKRFTETDKFTFNKEQNEYTAIDSTLSNAFTNDYTTHKGGLDYSYTFGRGTSISVGADYQYAILDVDQKFPDAINVNRTFNNVLPNVSVRWAVSKTKNIRIRYRTRTNAPSAAQLQNVVNNTNPILLSTGNPNLQQEYNHFVFGRYRLTNPDKGRMLFFILLGSATQNYISNSTIIADRDTTINGVALNRGTQLTSPVNLDGNWNTRGFIFYNVPIKFIKSNFSTRSGVSYSRVPALINNQTNFSNTTNFSERITISSNISKNVDFTIGYSANYNVVKNTILPELNNNYFFHTASARLTWIFWKNIVFRTDANQTLYSGLSDAFNQNYLLWNASIGKKFLKGKSGELSLSVFDLLNQNNSINREVTQTFVEDTRTQVLNRYFMLTFTYTLRAYKTGSKKENQDMERRYQRWKQRR
jgi:hypothetical protein